MNTLSNYLIAHPVQYAISIILITAANTVVVLHFLGFL